MLGLWYGESGRTDKRGKMSFDLTSAKQFPHTLELDEGLGWIGVKAKTADGDYTFPVGTGLVRLNAGEHELTFHQSPGSRVEGRVLGVPPNAGLFVAIATPEGDLLPLDVRRDELREMTELGAPGTFAFSLVPEGDRELRVGTRQELAAGRWRLREPFEARRGAPVRLEVEL